MRWKPPGTHHCSTCGVCRIGFDHHCPWVGEFLRFESLLSSIDAFINSARKLRHHWPTESLPGLACPDVDHDTSCEPTTLTSPEDPRHCCAGSIPRGRLGHGHLVESPLLLDYMRRPSRTLDRRYPTRFPPVTEAAPPGAIVAEWASRVPAACPLGGPRRCRNSGLAIRHCACFVEHTCVTTLTPDACPLQAMTVAVASDVTRGQSTLDSDRVRTREPRAGQSVRTTTSRFVCIPYSETPESFANTSAVRHILMAPGSSPNIHNTQRIYSIPIEERVYDLGWRENWRRVLTQPLFDCGSHHRGSVVCPL